MQDARAVVATRVGVVKLHEALAHRERVRREPGADEDNGRVREVAHVTGKVVLGQREVEVGASVRDRGRQALRLRATLVVVRRVEVLDAVLRGVLHARRVVRIRVRARNENRTVTDEHRARVVHARGPCWA